MNSKTRMTWQKDMVFDVEVNGHHILLDADEKWGGNNAGPRPKPLVLAALSGCSGMDVVSILDKMKLNDYTMIVDVDGEMTETHPMYYHSIEMTFIFSGANLPIDKIEKAIKLSTEQYCGVFAMLQKSAEITVKLIVNDIEVIL